METGIFIGVDIGGTFTDFVVYQPATGQLDTFKLLSTPHDPAEAVLQGIDQIKMTLRVSENPKGLELHIIHGSTVATNALLERKGARTALVTTRGFRDVLQIGRQNRPELYDFASAPPPPLVPEHLRFEVDERISAQGEVLQPLDPSQVQALIPELRQQEVESVAVCLLFSFLHPQHEQHIAQALRSAGFFVSPSGEILPEYREYERASTTTVNAYVSPVLDRYLQRLEQELPETHLRVMQSNGGAIRLAEARRSGVRCILSGPAGGVIGAKYAAETALSPALRGKGVRLITFDMGGTSTDVSLIDGEPQVTTEAVVGGCPIRIPLLDIHTIGAGGGSIAYLDAGGALRVGPHSAGADPGPACYGKGELPTVTDANLVLGRLPAEHFLGGQMPLDKQRAWSALQRLGEVMSLSPEEAALGVVEVVNAHMERALRVISVERGHDPQGGGGLPPFTLLAFGGAGGLHAADLARRLGIPHLLAPPLASTLSAFGMLAASVVKDYTQTVMLPGDTPLEELAALLQPLAEKGKREVQDEGIPPEDIHTEPFLDMRYQGQSYELTTPFSPAVLEDFHILHRQAYGYARPEAKLEIVNLRLRAVGSARPPVLPTRPQADPDPAPALLDYRPVTFTSGTLRLPFYHGEALQPGNRLNGPAAVVRPDTTILLGPSDSAVVDGYGNLLATIGA
ncbi:MAG: hydantoinase/oxoprolinase family protein [Anaerolineales bacterium]|nr:hydantoinase/oxoprolinase family protein [Anaerolineales bacterium]